MRTLAVLLAASCLLAVLAVSTAAADNYVVGNCQKSGACVGVCVADADTSCWNGGDICFGASYEIPFCLYPQS